ncbi:MAG: hypothetical protein A2033_19555 [Bacteroidetes bacterium GWA2_31_9]|nr:MAG: hypothetical protein A2033_19555 [Bacteroidetes bacterium GWA2_31_9]
MRKFTFLVIAIALIGYSNILNAQVPILEKTYDVSGKAKRGLLGGVEINKEKGTFDMYYMIPSIFGSAENVSSFNKDIPCEVYTYDKELNLVSNSKVDVRPRSFDWAVYKGLYSYEIVRFMINIGGISFQKVDRQYGYDPKTGKYSINRETILDKEKPRTADGNKYTSGYSYDVAAERSSMVFAGKKIEKTEETKKNLLHLFHHYMHYDVLYCDKDLNVSVTDSIDFEYMTMPWYSGQITDDRIETNDELARDWVMIFIADYHPKGLPFRAPNPTYYTYIRINPQGKIVDKFNFDSPANLWKIGGVYEKNNSVYIYGSAINQDRENKNRENFYGSKGFDDFTHYQFGKISNGKFDFLTCTSLKDIQAKQLKPVGQKNAIELDGKYAVTTEIKVLNTGDIYISYQKYDMKEKEYKDLSLFQFDASGNIKKSYGLDIKSNISIKWGDAYDMPANNYFYTSGDNKSLYWFIRSTKAVSGSIGSNMLGINYCSINIETGELSELKTFGNDKKNPFYVFNITKPVQLDNNIYFFSEDKGKGGSNMRLTRVDISK